MNSKMKRLAGACALALLVSGCGGSSGDGGLVAAPIARSSMSMALMTTVLDASSRQPVNLAANEKVTLVIYGPDADKIVNGEGVSLYDPASRTAGPLTSADGIFTLYVKPTTSGPFAYNVRLVASANNFVTSSQDLILRDTDLNADGTVRTLQVPISLISMAPNAQPDSVTAAQVSSKLAAGGATAEAIALSTPSATAVVDGSASPVALGSASVSIPKATVAYADAAKTKPLPAGDVSVNVVYNNNATTDSLAAFPGGFLARQDPNGQALSEPAGFVSGGFASVEISTKAADGTITKAKTFDRPITLTIPVPQGTINPETGAVVQPGDVIPIWSYDTTTGDWSVMKLNSTGAIITGTLGALAADNTYPVTFVTDHLSYFNLDWFFWKEVIPGKSSVGQCATAPITIKGAQGKPLYLEASLPGGGWSHAWFLDGGASDPAVDKITYAPKGLKMRVDAYYGTNRADATRKVGSVTVSDVCSGVSLDVSVAMSRLLPTVKTASQSVLVREVCSNDATRSANAPSDTVTAISAGVPIVVAGTNSAGVATLPGLIVGKTYKVSVAHRDGRTSVLNTTIAETNSQLRIDFPVACRTVTGAVSS